MKKAGVAVLFLLLANCFNYTEEIWINEDLSGKIKLTFDFGEMFSSILNSAAARNDTANQSQFFQPGKSFKDLTSLKGVTLLDTQTICTEKKFTLVSEFKFTALDKLNQLKKIISQSEFIPVFKSKAMANGLVRMERVRTANPKEGALTTGTDESDSMALSMTNAMLGDAFVKYIVHSKKPVFRSNADSSWEEGGVQSFSWKYSITKPVGRDTVLYMEIPKNKLESKTTAAGLSFYIWPQELVADSLKRLVGGRALVWGKIDTLTEFNYTLGIAEADANHASPQRIRYLHISFLKGDRASTLTFGETASAASASNLQSSEDIPLLLDQRSVVKVISNYNNFLGWKIAKKDAASCVLQKL
jgi:hypothetical protein